MKLGLLPLVVAACSTPPPLVLAPSVFVPNWNFCDRTPLAECAVSNECRVAQEAEDDVTRFVCRPWTEPHEP